MSLKVSIIIPVYKVEDYIIKCISSVIRQRDFESFEVLVINDGTTDKSIEKIEDMIAAHPNIFLINQANAGLSEARNTGIKKAKGEYISFVDSDDWIDPEMISTMYNRAVQTNSDIAVCKTKKIYPENSDRAELIADGFDQETILGREETIMYYFEHQRVNGYAWNKIYRRTLFVENGILFPEGKKYEDIPTTFQLIWYSNKVMFLDKVFYNYLQRSDSITKSSNLGLWDLIENIYFIERFLQEKKSKSKYENEFFHFLISHVFIVYLEILKNEKNENFYILKQNIRKEIKKQLFWKILTNRKVSFKNKVKYLLMKMEADTLVSILLKAKNRNMAL